MNFFINFNDFQAKRVAASDAVPSDPVAKKPRLEEGQIRGIKEQIAKRFDAPKEASITVSSIK